MKFSYQMVVLAVLIIVGYPAILLTGLYMLIETSSPGMVEELFLLDAGSAIINISGFVFRTLYITVPTAIVVVAGCCLVRLMLTLISKKQ